MRGRRDPPNPPCSPPPRDASGALHDISVRDSDITLHLATTPRLSPQFRIGGQPR